MQAYISKYALEHGITRIEGDVSEDGERFSVNSYNVYGVGQWHKTKKEAIAQANKMRNEAIELFQQKLDRLHRLVFK